MTVDNIGDITSERTTNYSSKLHPDISNYPVKKSFTHAKKLKSDWVCTNKSRIHAERRFHRLGKSENQAQDMDSEVEVNVVFC